MVTAKENHMADFTFERYYTSWDELSVFPPTPASLALARTFGVELAQAYLTQSPELAGKKFPDTISELGGYVRGAAGRLPLDTYCNFANAAQNTVSYVRARERLVNYLGTEVVAGLDGLVGLEEV
jgi:hypothetical protein